MKTRFRQLLRYLLPAILCLLLVATIIATIGTVRLVREEIFDRQHNIAVQIKNDLDYRFAQHEEFANTIMLSIQSNLNSESQTYDEQYNEYSNISKQLTAYKRKGMICDIHLYVPSEKMYSTQRDLLYPISDLIGNEVYTPCLFPGIHWLKTEKINVSIDDSMYAIACSQTMKSTKNYSQLAGVLFLYISVNELNNIFTADPSLNGQVFLVDEDGKILAHPDTGLINTYLPEQETAFLKSSNSDCKKVNEGLMSFCKLNNEDWYVVVRTPLSSSVVLSSAGAILLASLWIVTALFFVFIVVMYSNNSVFGEAIYHLQSMIRTVTSGNSEVEKPHKKLFLFSNSHLQAEMEQTVQDMASAIEKQYQEQLELANYQMQSLQSQIKPHFLYNTLDIIKWMVVEHKYSDCIWTINALSKYLRMSINWNSNVVTLREEIELAQTYLDIIQKRFAGRFVIGFDIEDETLECLIPRFILQPIVENALIHGLLYCEKPDARLEIRAWEESGFLCIDVEDSGNGMDAETLAKLSDGYCEEKKGYGLKNVRTRLKIFGGESTSFEIFSHPGTGTCVSMKMPFSTSENSERC